MKLIKFICSLLLCLPLQAQIITTVAGNGSFGYSGDGGPAINARLGVMYYCYPAFDNAGNMYITQTTASTIRKIDATGVITTIAGIPNVAGYAGDGGPATGARLHLPECIAIDNADNIYFTDQDGTIIRKIDPAGIITTVSSSTATTTCGVGDGGPLALAQFRSISAISFDKGNNLYISEFWCSVVRKVNTAGIIKTIAGNSTTGFSGDGGQATQAQLAYPCKVAIDNIGNVYIPDLQNHRIRKVTPGGIITTIAGNGIQGNSGNGGAAISATLEYPGSVVIDMAGNLYLGCDNNIIRKVDGAGIISDFAGNGIPGYSGDGGPAIQASLLLTLGRISIDHNNNIHFVNEIGYVIRKIPICKGVVISQHPDPVSLCNTGSAAFSITASNAIGYQWQVNTGSGFTDIIDNVTYAGAASNALSITGATASMNNYQFRCGAINNCGTDYSATTLLNVTTPVTPAMTVFTASNNICEGATANFTATPTNGGNAPGYQWQKNGVPVGSNSSAYSENTFINGDVITCVLTSNASCLTAATAVSTPVAITVMPAVVPSVSISPSANNFCAGTPVTFTSTVTNGGTQPDFTWFKNNVNLFLNAPTYSDNSLKDGDEIHCVALSHMACAVPQLALSAPVAMGVKPVVTPGITIAGPGSPACNNTLVTFNATVSNEGNTPLFQWQKNGQPAGTNTPTYSDNSLKNGDIISCVLTSNANCITQATVIANPVNAVIQPDPVIPLDKSNTICENGIRELDAGKFSSYQWNDGSTNRRLTVNTPGTYTVTVADQFGCTATDLVDITVVLPAPKNFLPDDTVVCSYGSIELKPITLFSNYQWNTGAASSFLSVSKAGQYWLRVKDRFGCEGTDAIIVLPKECITGFHMPNAFTPNNDGKNDQIKPVIGGMVKKYQFRVYNRWGQVVFTSNNTEKAWDGTFNGLIQNGYTYAWICVFQLEGGLQQVKRGNLVLIR